MYNCPICYRKALPNARQAKCSVGSKSYHLKCISLSADVQNYIQTNASIWYCSKCMVEILPFNHIEDDDTFISEVNNMDINTQTLESLSELLFNPFELSTDDQYSPLYDIDPDVISTTLQWRHNGHDSVSNHQPHDCLFSRLFRRRSKKTSKLRVTGLCAGNSPGTGEFPAQMASNAENVSIWWRHHEWAGLPYRP